MDIKLHRIELRQINLRHFLCLVLFISGLFFDNFVGVLFLLVFGVLASFMKKFHVFLDGLIILVIIYSIAYALFGVTISGISIGDMYIPVLMPLLAFLFVMWNDEAEIKNGGMYLVYLMLGIEISSLISVIGYNYKVRYLITMPLTGTEMSPVNLNAYGAMGVALLYWGLQYAYGRLEKIISIVICIISIYVTIVTAKYTNMVLLFSILLLNHFLFKSETKKILLLGIVALLFCYFFVDFSKLSIITRTKEFSPQASMNSRLKMWEIYFPELFYKPFSGNEIRNPYHKWAHNILIDTYVQNGIVVMGMLLVLFIVHFFDAIKFLKSSRIYTGDKSLFLSLSIANILTFMIEPAYQGFPFMVIIEFIIIAYIHKANSFAYGVE